jgi:hypothetical protein
VEVPLPDADHLGPEGLHHVHRPGAQHLPLRPGAQHPGAQAQPPVQGAYLAVEGLQRGRQPLGRPAEGGLVVGGGGNPLAN